MGYREEKYLPETVVNMLAFLGWNPGTDQELFSLEELVEAFSLDHVNKAGAKFDIQKTHWFQQQYMHDAPMDYLIQEFLPTLRAKGIEKSNAYIEEVIKTVKERAVFVTDFWELCWFYFVAPQEFDKKASKKAWKQDTPLLMQELISVLQTIEDFTENNLKEVVKPWIENKGVGFGKVMQPLRLALVGAMRGPDVFHIASSIGKNECINRLNFAIDELE
jgi:glutamyl-tRNA synthetase